MTPAIEGVSMVLLGSFNPRIFHPTWFASQQLLRETEANEATIEVIHPELAAFSTPLFRLQVTNDRFVLETADPSFYEPLRDLLLGTFRILTHTPVKAMGLNRHLHYLMPSESAWHALGHRLAPKDLWSQLLNKPGMRSLTMEGIRNDGQKGYIRVTVEPSLKTQPGVYLSLNDHFEVKNLEASIGCQEMLDTLESSWRPFLQLSESLAQLLEQ